MKRCPVCGAHAVEEAGTCFECFYHFDTLSTEDVRKLDMPITDPVESSQGEEESPPPALVPQVPPTRNFSVEIDPGAAGTRCIEAHHGSFYIGRAVFNDLVIDEELIMRRHAHLYRLEQGVFMELLSTNAEATVNGQAINHIGLISDGDVIGLASCDLVVHC